MSSERPDRRQQSVFSLYYFSASCASPGCKWHHNDSLHYIRHTVIQKVDLPDGSGVKVWCSFWWRSYSVCFSIFPTTLQVAPSESRRDSLGRSPSPEYNGC